MNALRALVPSCLIVLSLASGESVSAQHRQLPDCQTARQRYNALDHQLNGESDGTPGDLKSGTNALLRFITQTTRTLLQEDHSESKVQAFLNCMETAKDGQGRGNLTNAPQVQLVPAPTPVAMVTSLLLRGGFGMQDRPLVQCFAREGARWRLVGQSREDFNGLTFNTYRIRSPLPKEAWILLSGTVIGGTGADLRLEILGCSARRLRSVWSRDDIVQGKITVHPTRVELTYSKGADQVRKLSSNWEIGTSSIIHYKGTAEPVRFNQILRVTRQGLQP